MELKEHRLFMLFMSHNTLSSIGAIKHEWYDSLDESSVFVTVYFNTAQCLFSWDSL